MKDPKVIETIKRKDIPDNVKEKAIAEARLIAKQGVANFSDDETLSTFACWKDTPSGDTFWREIEAADEIQKVED